MEGDTKKTVAGSQLITLHFTVHIIDTEKRSWRGLKAKNMAENGSNAFILAFHQPS